MRGRTAAAALLLLPQLAAAGVTGAACVGGASPPPYQVFTFSSGQLKTAGGCLAAAATPITDGTALALKPCDPSDPAQRFAYTAAGPISLTSASQPAMCVNLAGYGTAPGTAAWLFTCSAGNCKGNCQWAQGAGGTLVNPGSGLCLDSGAEPPPPPAPPTCDPGSPSAGLPFCDYTQPVAARVQDLWSRLSEAQRLQLFSIPIQPNAYDPALNLPSVYWDITCIAGLSPGRIDPNPNATVFPNTIGQAASFDTDLVARIARATAEEGRIVNQINRRLTNGRTWQGVLCDGGPLANTAHDPRCSCAGARARVRHTKAAPLDHLLPHSLSLSLLSRGSHL
jgi:hypothetical protein